MTKIFPKIQKNCLKRFFGAFSLLQSPKNRNYVGLNKIIRGHAVSISPCLTTANPPKHLSEPYGVRAKQWTSSPCPRLQRPQAVLLAQQVGEGRQHGGRVEPQPGVGRASRPSSRWGSCGHLAPCTSLAAAQGFLPVLPGQGEKLGRAISGGT